MLIAIINKLLNYFYCIEKFSYMYLRKNIFINSNIAIKDRVKLDYSSINNIIIPEVFNQYFIDRDKK